MSSSEHDENIFILSSTDNIIDKHLNNINNTLTETINNLTVNDETDDRLDHDSLLMVLHELRTENDALRSGYNRLLKKNKEYKLKCIGYCNYATKYYKENLQLKKNLNK